MKVIPETPPAH